MAVTLSKIPHAWRIAVTGGSCSGKTTFCHRLADLYPSQVEIVEEVAARLISGVGIDQQQLSEEGRRALQIAIYHGQIEAEQFVACERLLVADRGSVDAAAYWPEGSQEFWRVVDSSLNEQLARYDVAVWLESAARVGRYTRSRVRSESEDCSLRMGLAILDLWRPHPNLIVIPARENLEEKWANFLHVLEPWL